MANTSIKLKELFTDEPMDFSMAQNMRKLGLYPEDLKGKGVTVSVRISGCYESDVLVQHKKAYDSIMEHKNLYTFFSSPVVHDIEGLQNCKYTCKYLWVKIKDRMCFGENRLIVTNGPAPDIAANEPYYNAKDFDLDEFWNIVSRLTDMYENPEKAHEPITLKQDNGMCGTAYKCREIVVK